MNEKRLRRPPRLWEKLQPLVREKRRAPTLAEHVLWQELRAHRPGGVRFRRQHAIGPYIVDFYSVRARLVIELDGASHMGREEDDDDRQSYLEALDLRVLRFANDDVLKSHESLQEVVGAIEETVRAGSRLALSSQGEGAGG